MSVLGVSSSFILSTLAYLRLHSRKKKLETHFIEKILYSCARKFYLWNLSVLCVSEVQNWRGICVRRRSLLRLDFQRTYRVSPVYKTVGCLLLSLRNRFWAFQSWKRISVTKETSTFEWLLVWTTRLFSWLDSTRGKGVGDLPSLLLPRKVTSCKVVEFTVGSLIVPERVQEFGD